MKSRLIEYQAAFSLSLCLIFCAAIAFVQLYSYLCKDKMERLIDNYAETNSFRTDTH